MPEIKWIARIRGWRPLSIAELEGVRLPKDLGYMTGWAVADGDGVITLSIELPRWTFTAAMRTHQESGAVVLAPPPASLLMFGPNVRFPEQASMQFCDIRFDADEDQMQPIANGIRQLPFLDVGRFGEPGDDREGRPMDGLFLENGAWYWHRSSWQGDVWQQINFVVDHWVDRVVTRGFIKTGENRSYRRTGGLKTGWQVRLETIAILCSSC